jgi:hypothetical protein
LRGAVDAVTKRVASVWSVITGFLTSVRRSWQDLRTRVTNWATIQIRHAQAVALTLKWLVFTWLPRQLGKLANEVKAWAAELIAKAEAKAKSLFDGVLSWATRQLQGLLGLLDTLRTWAIKQIGGLLDTVSRLAKQVFGVLSTPERLVEWIIEAMVSSLIRWGERNLHRIEALIAAKRAVIWRIAITIIEDVLHAII